MQTFEEFVSDLQSRGGVANLFFEQSIFRLSHLLARVVSIADAAEVEYEVVGGMAVVVYVEDADPSLTMTTRDVDLMIRRHDLKRLTEEAKKHGFDYRHSAGLDMLIPRTETKAVNAVHILFSGEKVHPAQAVPNPEIRPRAMEIKGAKVMVIGVADLIRMKLSAYRDKDRVHVRVLDECGLITRSVEDSLPAELSARLEHVRATQ